MFYADDSGILVLHQLKHRIWISDQTTHKGLLTCGWVLSGVVRIDGVPRNSGKMKIRLIDRRWYDSVVQSLCLYRWSTSVVGDDSKYNNDGFLHSTTG